MRALASTFRREVVASRLTELFQAIVRLRVVGVGYGDHLPNRIRDCPRAIDVPVERLLLTRAPPPIARSFASQLPERRGEGNGRCVGVAQHVHGLLEPMLAQPGMRRKPGAFLEGAAEVEARQPGLGGESGERDVRITVRAEAFDGAEQSLRPQPTRGRLERGWRAAVRSQDARGQEFYQLMSEQRIQSPIALQ